MSDFGAKQTGQSFSSVHSMSEETLIREGSLLTLKLVMDRRLTTAKSGK